MNRTTSTNNTGTLQKATLLKLAVDVHARHYTVARQVDHSRVQPPQKMDPFKFVLWAISQKTLAERVVVCYESGPFGFTLARALIKGGIECIVMAAQRLDERCKRVQTDKVDALEIASRLDRYLAGNTHALSVVKIPTLKQQHRRSESRQRSQLLKTRKQMEAQGRSLLVFNGYTQAPSQWWKNRWWEMGQKHWPVEVMEMLAVWRELLLELDKKIEGLTKKIERSIKEYLPASMPQLPVGFGVLTWVMLCREVLEWSRFKNRKQVGSFTGLVASECSSGQSQRQGSVTKVGNPRMRALAVELIWRMLQFQPEYRVVKKWRPFLDRTRSKSQRKKIIVAMARECSVDVWRLATGQTTPEQLGLRLGGVKFLELKED
jgi:transposase